MNDFLSSLKIAATGLHAQTARMRIIAENLANADSAGKTAGVTSVRSLRDSTRGGNKSGSGRCGTAPTADRSGAARPVT